MGQFEKLFKDIVKPKEYKYNPALSNEANAGNLRRLALMEHNVKTIYETLEGIYGEEYATKLATLILNKSFVVTNLENYTNSKRPYITGRIDLGEYIHKENRRGWGGLYRQFNVFLHRVSGVLLSQTREYGEIELYDFFICLSLYVESIKRIYDREKKVKYLTHLIFKQIIMVLGAEEGFMQPFTLCILDKRAYDRAVFAKGSNALRPGIGNNVYAIPNLAPSEKEKYPQIHSTYINYIETIQDFLRYYNNNVHEDGLRFTLPKIRIYADGVNKLLPEIIESISYDTGIDEGLVSDIFNRVGFDSENPRKWSRAFKKAAAELEKIVKKPSIKSSPIKKERGRFLSVNWNNVMTRVKALFDQEYINYLNISDRRLAYTISQIEKLEKKVPALELIIGNRIYKDTTTTFFKKLASEVTIEYKYLIEGCETLEDYREKLRQAIHDAQSINQTRFQIIGRQITDNYRLNVKVNEVDEDMVSETYSVLKEETEKLKSIYSAPFTYELCIQKYFRDKSKQYYVLVK